MDSSRSSGTACVTVLSVAELLTLILSHVDVRTLLFAQRVSRTFRAVIAASPVLQRNLFLQLEPPQRAVIDDTTASARGNAAQLVTYDNESCHKPRYIRHVQLNPLLVRSFPNFFPKSDVGGEREGFTRLDWGRNAERAAAYARPTASWRRMFLSDPLPENARLVWDISSMGGSSRSRIHLQRAGEGVRMGLLYDLIQDLMEKGRHENGDFTVRWQLAEPYTEAERLREHADWEHFIVALEGQQFDMDVVVCHAVSCTSFGDDVGQDMTVFRSKAPDVASFDSFEKEDMTFNMQDVLMDL
ncbi:hypothetical protein MMYC01_206818 [Madurella mycetomatis]|uniref:F-box domain-containing protein n=1 Tax=Madurella mycetomatis TaxID=100816 RepID=A0A175VWR3_9PEZI|nr:hypothetical protein MMYC01_210425 [Madurella mycetomatis]KXX75978.1 hypothetical protein MMYC01_206818 [Madurella mycetomatis]